MFNRGRDFKVFSLRAIMFGAIGWTIIFSIAGFQSTPLTGIMILICTGTGVLLGVIGLWLYSNEGKIFP